MKREDLIEKIEGYFGTLDGIEHLTTNALNKINNTLHTNTIDSQLMELINKGENIAAIKLCRKLKSYDLRTSRDYVYYLMGK